MDSSKRRASFGGGLGLILACLFGCSQARLVKTDPFFGEFFEKTSLLMTEEEIDLYLHLPDKESKAEFIADFWKIRDPDPTSADNENKGEFERRIQFSNEWFGVLGQVRRKPAPASLHRDRGWNTDRGVAYIVLGPPDFISLSWSIAAREKVDPEDGYRLSSAALWYYERYRLSLYFTPLDPQELDPTADALDQSFKPPATKIRTLSTNSEAMKLAQEDWVSRDHRQGLGEPLRFKADYRRGGLEISIPVKSVRFRENEDKILSAAFAVDVRVYRNNRKVDDVAFSKSFAFREAEAEKLTRLDLRVPYEPAGKGSYLFDLIVRADDPSLLSRRRQYIRVKI
ncbi:MAG: GWxTD domain-containing protein [Candidatus Aminicenantes bacterium]|nr:GWxTD domain-containing protein [Candidatus Aminicenantes bacterium]